MFNLDLEEPLLNLDINLGDGHVSRVVIYEGDNPYEISKEFCKLYSLDDVIEEKITNYLIE